MQCPFCSHADTQVKDSRPTTGNSTVKRRRICPACGGRFNTLEHVQLRELLVQKKDHSIQPFEREKLLRSITLATRKRPIEAEQIERMINGLIRQLETSGEITIASDHIGTCVMRGLLGLDDVAYMRYASVYRDFSNISDFEAIITEIQDSRGK